MKHPEKILVEVSKSRVFAQLYVSRGKNTADIDESLPKRTVTSTLVDQKARLKDVPRKNAGKFGAGSPLLIVGSGRRVAVVPPCSGHLTEIPGRGTTARQARLGTTGGEL